eukprot:IDg10084t1
MGKSSHAKFQPGHAIKFEIKVTACHPGSCEVSSAMCLFCVTIEREEKV